MKHTGQIPDPALAIGLMSGTSGDGMDAAVVEISGHGLSTKVKLKAFITLPYDDAVRGRLLKLAGGETGGTREICAMHFLLGRLSADACLKACEAANVNPEDISFVGSHGHTLYHAPAYSDYLGLKVRGTLQMGEPSLISEALGCMVVSDFRVRDMAAGGQGAPLVPYTEYLLYRMVDRTVALQNIGGIGNITVLPKGGSLKDTYAFDTGPGNMVMDELASRITNGTQRYDEDGRLARSGSVSRELLHYMLEDSYLKVQPPKSTGREVYGKAYVDVLVQKGQALGLSLADILATATRFTAETIRVGIESFCIPAPQRLIVGGGGSMNPVLMHHIADCLPGMEVMRNEDLGLDSNAKEAIAFAILANETLHMHCSNVPAATGAGHPAILGKISF